VASEFGKLMMQEVAPSPSSSPQWGEGQGEGKGVSGVQPLNIWCTTKMGKKD